MKSLINAKGRLVVPTLALSLLFSALAWPLRAAEPSDAATELKALVSKVQTKLREGSRSEADLAAELKEFDALLAKHKAEKTDDTANILYLKAMLYAEVFQKFPESLALIQQMKTDFPDTQPAKHADEICAALKQREEAAKMEKLLAQGATFPPFEEKDLEGQPMSVAKYKGKVVLIDFWATWCPPCRAELPNVIKVYEKYHAKGFEILGISLDESQQKLKDFLKANDMTWQQYFDGKRWENKLSTKYGVQSIPATFLLDGQGKIIGRDLRGSALEAAVAAALPKP